MKKCELLAPAGSLERLKMAVQYGADAVYLGGRSFSLRSAAENFSAEQMKEGICYAHERGKRVYIAANIFPRNGDLEGLREFAREIDALAVDAVIVSDLGAFDVMREFAPSTDIHISTQANTVNILSARRWCEMGAKRVILARELSLGEVREISARLPGETEVFVHGAMCVSYSGRCLLSNYLINRDGNRGECAQPCRWRYCLVEEKRPGEYIPIEEDERGSFILNSKDLCMLEHIPELIESGVSSLKIEGRMKSEFYTATVVKAYREAIDRYYENPAAYVLDPLWLDEVRKVSHRDYSTGFFFGYPGQIYENSSYIRTYNIVGLVKDYDPATKTALIEQRNRFYEGDELEVLQPGVPFFTQKALGMRNELGEPLMVAPHAQMRLILPMERPVVKNAILRKKADDGGADAE